MKKTKKRILSGLLALAMLNIGSFALAAEQPDTVMDGYDILLNDDFEEERREWFFNANYGWKTNARTGNYSLGCVGTYTGSNAKRVVEVEPNTKYTVTYWVKQISGSHELYVYGSGTTELIKQAYSTASENWVQKSATFTTGESDYAVTLRFWDNASNPSEFYIDDVVVRKMTTEVEKAEKNKLLDGGFQAARGVYWQAQNCEWLMIKGWGTAWPRSGIATDGFLYHKGETAYGAGETISQTVEVEPGKKYMLSFWYKSNTAFYSKIYFDGVDTKNSSEYVSAWCDNETGTTANKKVELSSYKQHRMYFTTEETTQNVKIQFMDYRVPDEYYIVIDDVKLTECNPENGNEALVNGDFEWGPQISGTDYNPFAWQKYKSGWFKTQSDVVYQGNYALMIPEARGNEYLAQHVDVEANTDYLLSWYAKGTEKKYNVIVYGLTEDAEGNLVMNDAGTHPQKTEIAKLESPGTSTSLWQNIDLPFNSGDYDIIRIEIDNDDRDYDLYLDEFTLTRRQPEITEATVLGYPAEGKTLFAIAESFDGYDKVTGINYQWQESADGTVWTDITGATDDEYAVTDATKQYRVAVTPVSSFATGETAYSDAVGADDKDLFEKKIVSVIQAKNEILSNDYAVYAAQKDYYKALICEVAAAREYEVDANITNLAKYEGRESKLVGIENVAVVSENDDILINIEFDSPAAEADLTKENIQLLCGNETIDYTITPVTEDGRIMGVKLDTENKFTNDENYQLTVKLGTWGNYSDSFEILNPVTVNGYELKNSAGDKVSGVSEITDGKLVINVKVSNNTYSAGKAMKVIAAVYNGDTLYAVKTESADVSLGDVFDKDITLDVPTSGLTTEWKTAVYVWDTDMITPLTIKKAKTYGSNVIKDTSKDITAAFIGGSITQGGKITTPFVESWQADRIGKITAINAGQGGTMSNYGTMRLYEEVLAYEPDIVFVDFAGNDVYLTDEQIKANAESIFKQIEAMEHQPVVVVWYWPHRNEANYLAAQAAWGEVADHYEVGVLNAHQLCKDEIAAGNATWDDYTLEDNVHPNEEMGIKIAALMYDYFKENYESLISDIKAMPKKYGSDEYTEPTHIASSNSDYATYDANWEDSEVSGVVTEGYNVPTSIPFESFMTSSTEGAKMTFKFRGTKILISTLMGENGKTAAYTITDSEGNVEKSGTLNNKGGTYWYENVILSLTGLKDTEHTLTITVNSGDGLFGIGDFWIDE